MESGLLEVLSCVYTAADNKEVTVLIGLDLSAAFDTVDHEILLERPQTEFGVEGMPLTWLRSYLDDRTQYVIIGQYQSTAIQLKVGVLQWSVLGPILFAVYASPVADVIASHGVQYHQYADDTQLHLAMRTDNTSAGLSVLAASTADVRTDTHWCCCCCCVCLATVCQWEIDSCLGNFVEQQSCVT